LFYERAKKLASRSREADSLNLLGRLLALVEKEPHTRAQQLLFQIAIFAGVDLGTRIIEAAVAENLQPGGRRPRLLL
jgi:hypothetical protein